MSLYCMTNHRTEEQLRRMRWLEDQGVCLFCPDGLADHAGLPVLWRGDHWTIAPNDFPYQGTSLHLLLIPREHVTDLLDLSPPARAELWDALAFARDHHALEYYALAARNGDCEYTGGTIRHLHLHLLVGDPSSDAPVRVRLSSPGPAR